MSKTITLLITVLISTMPALAQTITGSVISSPEHSAVAGATVTLLNSHTATVSDGRGNFKIVSSAGNDTLEVSHVGYNNKKILVKSGMTNPITVVLERATRELKDVTVVSTGYQTVSRERATGSFDKIDSTIFNRPVSTDILSRLEGVASGTFFSKTGGTQDITIRGLSTINANNTGPLVILDNFPYEGDISNLNPNDVQDITILKDAAAASIWGAKAGNGVIVITSKKGNYGRPFKLSLNSNITVQQKPDYFRSRDFIAPSDFIGVEQVLFNNGFYNSYLSNTVYGVTISPAVEIMAKQRAGTLSATDAAAQLAALANHDVRNDYAKYLNRDAVKQQYSLSMGGGGATINYRVSAGIDQAPTTTVGNQQQRITVASLTQFRPLRPLEMSAGFNYSNTRSTFNGFPVVPASSDKSVMYPYARLADANGQHLALPRDLRSGYVDTVGNGLLADWHYRPLDELDAADNTNALTDYLFKFSAGYQLLPGLKIEGSGQYEQAFGDLRYNYSTPTYYAKNLINLYSTITNGTLKRNIPYGGILDDLSTKLTAYALRGQIGYSKIFNNHHQLSVIAGAEQRETKTNTFQSRSYGYDGQLLTTVPVDYSTNFTYLYGLGSGKITYNNVYGQTDNRFVSVYGNGSYTLDDKYIVSASARKDASNLFGVNTNQKWNPLWSTGIAWNLSKENFYQLAWLPYLKFRATYGYSGNIDNTLSALPTITYASISNVLNLSYASVTSLPNPDLHWEKTGMLNLGVDFGSANNRLSGSLEYYHKSSSDLLTSTPIDPTIGGGTVMIKNAAAMTGTGVDIRINALLIDYRFKWQSQVLFSYVTNKVTNFSNELATKGSYAGFGYSITPLKGKDPYALISFKWGGLDPQIGDPIGYINHVASKDYANLVIPTTFDDMSIKGTTRPPYYGSWLNTFSYGGFSFSVNINYKLGYYFRRSTINYSSLFTNWTMNSDFADRWKKAGDEQHTDVPSMTYPSNSYRDNFYANSEATVEKGDVVRLQDVALSYTFRQKNHGAPVLKNPQLYTYFSNLPIIWRANHKGIDPDYGTLMAPRLSMSFGFKTDF